MNGISTEGRWGWVQTVAPEDDEPAWSHLQRIARLNNLPSIVTLLREWSGLPRQTATNISYDAARRVQYHLSVAAGQDYETYHRKYGSSCLLVGASNIPTQYREVAGGNPRQASFALPLVLPPCDQSKFCESCTAADRMRRGFTWFRRIHQVAGIEFCPANSERLMQRRFSYRSRSSVGSANEVRSEWSTEPRAECNPVESRRMRAYAELVSWLWRDGGEARVRALQDLLRERFYGVREKSAYEIIMRSYCGGTPANKWFNRNFRNYLGDGSVRTNLRTLSFDSVTLTFWILALVSDAIRIDTIVHDLEARLQV